MKRACPKRRDFVCVPPAGGGHTAIYLYFDTPYGVNCQVLFDTADRAW